MRNMMMPSTESEAESLVRTSRHGICAHLLNVISLICSNSNKNLQTHVDNGELVNKGDDNEQPGPGWLLTDQSPESKYNRPFILPRNFQRTLEHIDETESGEN